MTIRPLRPLKSDPITHTVVPSLLSTGARGGEGGKGEADGSAETREHGERGEGGRVGGGAPADQVDT